LPAQFHALNAKNKMLNYRKKKVVENGQLKMDNED